MLSLPLFTTNCCQTIYSRTEYNKKINIIKNTTINCVTNYAINCGIFEPKKFIAEMKFEKASIESLRRIRYTMKVIKVKLTKKFAQQGIY